MELDSLDSQTRFLGRWSMNLSGTMKTPGSVYPRTGLAVRDRFLEFNVRSPLESDLNPI